MARAEMLYFAYYLCFIPQREAALQNPKGSICFNLGFIGLDYRTRGFKILMGKCVFEKLENVLSPKGPKGSNCF